jgi:O-antigen/teichoic acid export membrane protein
MYSRYRTELRQTGTRCLPPTEVRWAWSTRGGKWNQLLRDGDGPWSTLSTSLSSGLFERHGASRVTLRRKRTDSPPAGDEQLADEAVAVTRKSVVSSVLWNSFSSLLGVPILAATTILLARILGVTGFGSYALYTLLIALFGGIADLGIGATILRQGALAAGKADEMGTLGAVRAGVTWALIQLPWNIALGFIILPSRTAGGLFALASLWNVLFSGCAHYLLMTNQLRVPSILNLLTLPLSSAATLATAATTHNASLVFGVSALSSNVLAFILLFAVPKRLRRAVFYPGRMRLSRSDVSFGIGTTINIQLNTLVFSKSELLFFGSARAAGRGQFAASQSIAARVTVVMDALVGNLSYGLTSALGRGDEVLQRNALLVTESVALLFLAVSPAALAGISVLSVPLFGSGFSAIAAPAVALGLMSLIQTGAAPLLSLRFAQKSVRPLIVAGIFGAAIDLGLGALLVPHLGVTGAVVASIFGSLSYLICTVALFRGDTRAMASSHMLRIAAIVGYSGVLAVGLLYLPKELGLILAAPLALVWTVVGFRLPLTRLTRPEAVDSLCDSLPTSLGRILRSSAARWVLSLPADRRNTDN